MRDYRKIKAYQLAEGLVLEIYKITKDFPKEELYGLTSQLRRAVVSITANIAEGASRQHKRDYLNFLYIARGSRVETECLLSLSCKLGYLDQNELNRIDALSQECARTLYGLIDSVAQEAV